MTGVGGVRPVEPGACAWDLKERAHVFEAEAQVHHCRQGEMGSSLRSDRLLGLCFHFLSCHLSQKKS